MAPPYLYKYMSLATAKIVLQNCTLRWSTPRKLNDPFDVQTDLRLDLDRGQIVKGTLEKLFESFYSGIPLDPSNKLGALIQATRSEFPEMHSEQFNDRFKGPINEGYDRLLAAAPGVFAEIRENMSRTKLLCLTEAPDNLLMWAHYAQNHSGVVLRFQAAVGVDSPWHLAKPVQYVSEVPEFMTSELLIDIGAGRTSLDPRPILDRLLYTKSAEWKYEREWRITAGDGRDPKAEHEDCKFHPRELSGLILGTRVSEEDQVELVSAIRDSYTFVDILKAEQVNSKFELDFSPIHHGLIQRISYET